MAQERNENRKSGQHVRDVMTRNPETVSSRDSIRDAARIMKDRDTGVVPVVDDKKVVGLVTDRDIVVRCIAEGRDVSGATVGDVMTKTVRSVKEDAPVDEVMQLMSNAQIRRVPVVDKNDVIVGIVSVADLTETGQPSKLGKTMTEISEGSGNN